MAKSSKEPGPEPRQPMSPAGDATDPPVSGDVNQVKAEADAEVYGTDAVDPAAPDDNIKAEDHAFIGKLTAIWLPHEAQSLSLRHQLGVLIRAKLKDLELDPKRGRAVRKVAAEQLGMSPSDLSRMCSFAARFRTFEQFKQAHPEATTWSYVKALLPQLNEPAQNGGMPPVREKKSTDKQRDATLKELKAIKEFIAEAGGEFNLKQARELEVVIEGIREEVESLVTFFKNPSQLA